MNSSETAWRWGLTARLGIAEFQMANPAWVVVTTLLPRAILQCLFFTLLGRVIGGEQVAIYAYVGSMAAVLTLAAAVSVMDVPLVDQWEGTFFRLRTGVLSPFVVFVLRSLPYPVLAFVCTLSAWIVVAPLTGLTGVALDVAPWLFVYLVMAVSTTAAGVACAALAVGRRTNVLVGNLLSYLILLACGVFLPPGDLWWVDYLGRVLPVRHGLEAVRAGMTGGNWLAPLAGEIAVGIGWTLVAWVVVRTQARRAHKYGFDDYS